MAQAELVKAFREGDWSQPTRLEQFLTFAEQSGGAAPADILKVLDALTSRSLAAEHGGLKNRCAALARLVEKGPAPELFLPFVKAMKTHDGVIRLVLQTLLPKVNDIRHHKELCALLKSKDVTLRRSAAAVLGQVGGRTTLETLSTWMMEPGFVGRTEATDVLFPIAGHHAISVLGPVLSVASTEEKLHILAYLAEPRYVEKDRAAAKEALSRVLTDRDPQVAFKAVVALSEIGTEDDWFSYVGPLTEGRDAKMVRVALAGAVRFATPRMVRELERLFRRGPTAVRMVVLEAAEAMADEVVLPLLVDALGHTNINVRTRAGAAITKLSVEGKVEVGRTIIWLLRSRDENVRRMASDIASRTPDPHAQLWPQLLLFLRDEDWWVRERVIDALVSMAGKDLTRHIVPYLGDPSDVIRRQTAAVLGRLMDQEALGALVRTATDDRDWWVRETAIESIGEIGDLRAVPYLVDMLARQPEARIVALKALANMHATDAAPHVAALLGESLDADGRRAVVECLEQIGDPSLAESLKILENDPDHRVRAAARDLLSGWQVSHEQWVGQNTIGQTLSLLDQLLYGTARANADDLILEGGRRPYIKKQGQLSILTDYTFGETEVKELIDPHLSVAQRRRLEAREDIDLSYEVKSQGLRFRANVFHQLTGVSAVFRFIKGEVPDLASLGLPPIVRALGGAKNGLVLVGGPAGSGKSTTLAALINYINQTTSRHIITLEDPIEHVHPSKQCLVTQREIGSHSRDYGTALRSTLREDPDVILIGELRDLPTIRFAVSAAETGHLVLGTMHTVSAESSVDRLISTFPPGQQPQVRSMLAGSLRAVICQHLLNRLDGQGRVLAVEVMLNNDAIANLVRKGKAHQIGSVIATAREIGMQSMDTELMALVQRGVVHHIEAYMKANNKSDFEALLGGAEASAAEAAARGA